MGYFSSTTTQKTELPEKTEAEKKLDSQIADVLLPGYLEELGYKVEETVKNVYENPDRVASLETQLEDIESQISIAETEGLPQQEVNSLKQKRNALSSDLAREKENATTEIGHDYTLNERGQKLEEERSRQLDRESQASEMFFDTFKKFASGNFSITPEQEQLISQQLGDIREPVMTMLNEVEKQYEATGKSMGQALNEYSAEIGKTGLSVEVALSAVEDRIKNTQSGILAGIGEEEKRVGETGQEVFAALKGIGAEIEKTGGETREMINDTFKLKSMLIANKMQDMYDKQRVATAEKAATLGRSPMDPRFQVEMQENLAKAISDSQLQLAVEESAALAGLTERTGQRREVLRAQEAEFTETQGRRMEEGARARTGVAESTGLREEQVAGSRADLAERTGQRQEGVAAQRVGVAERTGSGREAIAGQKAGLEENLQQYGADLRQQYGVGIPASQIGLGMDVAGYGQAVRQQGLSNIGGAIGTVGAEAGKMQAERMQQPTITQTKSGSVMGGIMGTIGSLAGGAKGILGGIGGLKK